MKAEDQPNNHEKDSQGRPKKLHMGIHTGMLESMGHNMYTSIGKSTVSTANFGTSAL
ncbi:hypothetical protein [Idiomarina baltica]|uniref:Uncharacterized protein n=1 Tax=Idiomarina baltica OS145 TaxID=314276 RepID=A0ABM9WQD2_9GAMM|nr:hypothetical protein [Idiomarina baltica]EAQ33200.1 hypothetical protein OS145_02490 [Idiomarina baltica OS145]